MTNPPDSGGMADGMRVALMDEFDPILGTHLAAVHEDVEMNVENEDIQMLEKMQTLLSNTRTQLARAVEEANQLQAWSSDEEGADNHPSGTARVEEPDAEALAKMSTKEREAAIKRARNREAARRSRQRKNERINQLSKDIKTLQQENVVLLKCIEDFTKKAITSKEEQLRMKEQLAALATPGAATIDTASLLIDNPLLIPMEDLAQTTAAEAVAAVVVARETETGAAGPSAAAAAAPITSPSRASLVAGLSLPSLAELQKLQNTEAGGSGQLTARGGGTLSARGAAVAEHIAMLSKENSPRDDEIDPTAAAAGVPPSTTATATTAAATTAAAPESNSVDVNMLFGAWNGSDKK